MLGDISREKAMKEFITNLNKLCPLFEPYVQAHKAEKEEQERQRWAFDCEMRHIQLSHFL